MKKEIQFQVYIENFDGISNWENYKTLEEAKEIFYPLYSSSLKSNKDHYELLKVEVTFDEDDEIVNEEVLEVLDEFDR